MSKHHKRVHNPDDYEETGYTRKDYRRLHETSKDRHLRYLIAFKKHVKRIERGMTPAQKEALRSPLEDLPIRINHTDQGVRDIAQWRLEMGR